MNIEDSAECRATLLSPAEQHPSSTRPVHPHKQEEKQMHQDERQAWLSRKVRMQLLCKGLYTGGGSRVRI